jgi:hypothetical protein
VVRLSPADYDHREYERGADEQPHGDPSAVSCFLTVRFACAPRRANPTGDSHARSDHAGARTPPSSTACPVRQARGAMETMRENTTGEIFFAQVGDGVFVPLERGDDGFPILFGQHTFGERLEHLLFLAHVVPVELGVRRLPPPRSGPR